ncbi:MFS transporter [Paractinoplanes deccanensis]|uniref:MFS transporter n=3 Tax=Paractinoplanes deccanensis TaxID=113561 RepID=UPI0031CE58B2
MTLTRYVGAAVCARLADEGARVAILLLALDRTGDEALGGLLIAALMVPHVVAAPITGALADAARRRRLLYFLAFLGYAAALLGGAASIGHATPLAAALLIVAGCCAPLLIGGLSSLLGDLAPTRLERAFGLDVMSYSLAGIAGPALAAVLADLAGASWSVAALAALVVAGAVLVASLPLPAASESAPPAPSVTSRPTSSAPASSAPASSAPASSAPASSAPASSAPASSAPASSAPAPSAPAPSAPAPSAPAPSAPAPSAPAPFRGASNRPRMSDFSDTETGSGGHGDGFGSVAGARPRRLGSPFAAVAVMVRKPRLGAVTLGTVFSMLGVGALPVIAALLAGEARRSELTGLILSAGAAGGLITSLVLTRWPIRRWAPESVVAVSLAATAVPFLLLAVLPAGWGGLPFFAIAGALGVPVSVAVFAVRDQESPPEIRTQVFTLGAGVKVTAAATGAAVAGLAAPAGVAALLAGIGICQALGALAVVLVGRVTPAEVAAPSIVSQAN